MDSKTSSKAYLAYALEEFDVMMYASDFDCLLLPPYLPADLEGLCDLMRHKVVRILLRIIQELDLDCLSTQNSVWERRGSRSSSPRLVSEED